MTKEEFVKQAKFYGYHDEDIVEMIAMVETARKDGIPMDYDAIILVEQPVY